MGGEDLRHSGAHRVPVAMLKSLRKGIKGGKWLVVGEEREASVVFGLITSHQPPTPS
jgi:hypothetical protein